MGPETEMGVNLRVRRAENIGDYQTPVVEDTVECRGTSLRGSYTGLGGSQHGLDEFIVENVWRPHRAGLRLGGTVVTMHVIVKTTVFVEFQCEVEVRTMDNVLCSIPLSA